MPESQALSMWSQFALGAYYYATLPDRKRRCAERVGNGQAPIMVLFYHRVANHHGNDWTLSEESFAKKRIGQLISGYRTNDCSC